jgi:hypothetical protein
MSKPSQNLYSTEKLAIHHSRRPFARWVYDYNDRQEIKKRNKVIRAVGATIFVAGLAALLAYYSHSASDDDDDSVLNKPITTYTTLDKEVV